jgi:hypothetical protein
MSLYFRVFDTSSECVETSEGITIFFQEKASQPHRPAPLRVVVPCLA